MNHLDVPIGNNSRNPENINAELPKFSYAKNRACVSHHFNIKKWTTLSGSGAVCVMTSESMDDPSRPPGIVLSAATSFWIPIQPKRGFDCLRDENFMSEVTIQLTGHKWDVLSNGGSLQEMAHTRNGHDPGNCVSLLRVNSENLSQSNMLILQETSSDPTRTYVIYALVDIIAMNVVLSTGDPDYVASQLEEYIPSS